MNPGRQLRRRILHSVFLLYLGLCTSIAAGQSLKPASVASLPAPNNNAELVQFDAPDTIQTGQVFRVVVTLRNTGADTWTAGDDSPHWLGSLSPDDSQFWRDHTRVELPRAAIASGETVAFSFDCNAPDVAGIYPFAWRMIEEWRGRFGDSARKLILVTDKPKPLPRACTYHSRTWQHEDGLPQSSVQSILQTRDGYIWMATQRGLARFDGVRFKVFNEKTSPEIKNPFIYSLCEGLDGSLWAGTYNAGLVRIHRGKFTLFTTTNGLAGNSIRSLFASRDGSIWIGTTTGLSRFMNNEFTTFNTAKGLSHDVVRAICEDTAGNLGIGTAAGINQISNLQVTTNFVATQDIPATQYVRSFAWRKRGDLLVGTDVGLAISYAGRTSQFTQEEGLIDHRVTACLEDSRGTIWVGTQSGLCRLSGTRWVRETASDGASFDVVSALLEDTEGNIWVGTKDGLHRLTVQHFTTYSQASGLAHNNVMSVREDRYGAIWFGTWGGGVHRMLKGKITVYDQKTSHPINQVLALGEDAKGNFWVGTDYLAGLYQFKDDIIKPYGKKEGLNSAVIRVIYEDKQSNLWIGTSEGLVLKRDDTFTCFTVNDGLAGNTVRAVVEDVEGNLWVGSSDGLSCLRDGQFTSLGSSHGLPKLTVHSLYCDSATNLWIGTAGGGLNRYRDGKFHNYTTANGLFSDDIHEILEDDSKYLWMSCRNGVFRIEKKQFDELDTGLIERLNCTSFGKRDGMLSAECTSVAKPAGWKARDGRLWFPTTKGLVVVDPNADLKSNSKPPPVFIEEVIADKKVFIPMTSSEASTFEESPDPMIIEPGRGDLEFHYTALSFRDPRKVLFKYQLEGMDADWVDAGERRVAYYTQMRHGTFRFRVLACNNDGVWNESGAALNVVVLPHVWQTWWFLTLQAVVGIGAVAGIVRYASTRRLHRKVAALEKQHAVEKERSRIARDVHDDLGAQLTEVLLLNDLARKSKHSPEELEKHLIKQGSAAREMGSRLDEIIWAVNPRNDSLDGLANYLYERVEMFFSATSIRLRLEVPQSLPNHAVSSEVRHHILLVVKETLNNIVKHSGATLVIFRLSFTSQGLTIEVQDDGKGFDQEQVRSFGNGVQNMRKRTEEISGTLRLSTAHGTGTTMRLQVRLPP